MGSQAFDIASIYEDKPPGYFAGSRDDIVALLKTGRDSAILELGCGTGATGCAALAAGKAGRYVGIELDQGAAEVAATVLTEVLCGDVQSLSLKGFEGSFDALIVSEILEHLTDPWATLRSLATCIKPGGMIYASSPNISHRDIIAKLIAGRFDYTADGIMDRTHLRWFTPASFHTLFEQAGITVTSIGPLVPLGRIARLLDAVTGGKFRHLFIPQIMISGFKA